METRSRRKCENIRLTYYLMFDLVTLFSDGFLIQIWCFFEASISVSQWDPVKTVTNKP